MCASCFEMIGTCFEGTFCGDIVSLGLISTSLQLGLRSEKVLTSIFN